MADDVEERLVALLRALRLQEQPPDPEVHLGELSRRDERISGLLHPVMEESIGSVPAEEQPLPHGLLERVAELRRRTARDHREGVEAPGCCRGTRRA